MVATQMIHGSLHIMPNESAPFLDTPFHEHHLLNWIYF